MRRRKTGKKKIGMRRRKTGKKNEDLTFCEIVGVTGFEGRCHKLYRLQT